jgi:hypothetical protein
MTSAPTIGLLGADKQAAVSAALAWPERQFLFVTDVPVADGWDLPNVQFQAGAPGNLCELFSRPHTQWVPLCARWIGRGMSVPTNALGTFQQMRVLRFLKGNFGDVVLSIYDQPAAGKCIVKGDFWHRPDATLVSDDLASQDITDPHACGLAYQPYWPWQRLLLATGWRTAGSLSLAVFHIHSEVCARDDVIGAGQTIAHPQVTDQTVAMLDALDHRGFFTFNWLEAGEQIRLSSFRPVPRALFRSVRRAGFDPFATVAPAGVRLAPAGLKFVVDITYTSYQSLAS